MGTAMLRMLKWRVLRKSMDSDEVLMDYDFGHLADGTRLLLYLSDRAIYISGAGALRRISYAGVASILDTKDLDLALWNPGAEDFEIISVTSGRYSRGMAAGFVRSRLASLPSYHRSALVDGEPWELSYHPWRPGAASRWVIRGPDETPGSKVTENRLFLGCRADVEALAAGSTPRPGYSTGFVPGSLGTLDMLVHWSHVLGDLDEADVALADSGEMAPAGWFAVLALDGDSLRVVDADNRARTHPRVRQVGVDSITLGNGKPEPRLSVTVNDPDTAPEGQVTYFLQDTPSAHRLLERVERATGG